MESIFQEKPPLSKMQQMLEKGKVKRTKEEDLVLAARDAERFRIVRDSNVGLSAEKQRELEEKGLS